MMGPYLKSPSSFSTCPKWRSQSEVVSKGRSSTCVLNNGRWVLKTSSTYFSSFFQASCNLPLCICDLWVHGWALGLPSFLKTRTSLPGNFFISSLVHPLTSSGYPHVVREVYQETPCGLSSLLNATPKVPAGLQKTQRSLTHHKLSSLQMDLTLSSCELAP